MSLYFFFRFRSILSSFLRGWDLVEWLERCASIPMITSSNPSGGSELTFRSDLLLIARGYHPEGLGKRYTNPQVYSFFSSFFSSFIPTYLLSFLI
jgi:hypothetical protein